MKVEKINDKFNKRDYTRIAKIRNAGVSQTMLAIKYKDRKGNLSQRTVEPYKLTGNDFWGYDPAKESIRRFKVKNLQSVKSTKSKFEPRWEIEMEEIMKQASNYYGFDSKKKIQAIEDAFKDDKIAKEVAYMIATSHEYKEPNTKSAIRLVKNYKWSEKKMSIDKMQGINKPVNKEKVFNIANSLNIKTLKPFMVVDKFQGITPQTPNHKILLDGHHRKEACEFKGIKEVPIYYGKYNGKAEKDIQELIEKKAKEILGGTMKDRYDWKEYNSLNENGIENKKNRTSLIKDRVLPNARNAVFATTAGLGGALAGAGLGYAASKIKKGATNTLIRKAGNKVLGGAVSKGRINQQTADKMIGSLTDGKLSKIRGVIGASAGAMAVAPKAKELGRIAERTTSLRKKHLNAFGTEPTEEDYEQAARLDPKNKLHQKTRQLFYTPESMIKSKKRDISLNSRIDEESASNVMKKMSSYYVEEIEKRASKAVKASLIGAGALAVPGMYLGGKATSTVLDPDAKARKTRVAAGALTGGALAGGLGYGLTKDSIDFGNSIKNIGDSARRVAGDFKESGRKLSALKRMAKMNKGMMKRGK